MSLFAKKNQFTQILAIPMAKKANIYPPIC